MKALLHLQDGKNETVELLIRISEEMGDLEEFVNLAYTSPYYKGGLCKGGWGWWWGPSLDWAWPDVVWCDSGRTDRSARGHREEKCVLCETAGQ